MKKKRFSLKTYLCEMFRNERRRKPFLVAVIVFAVVFSGLTAYRQAAEEKPEDIIIREDIVAANEGDIGVNNDEQGNLYRVSEDTGASANDQIRAAEAGDEEERTAIFVDVGGAVRVSGLFALPPKSRVADAIDAAGGLTEDADVKYLNRAALLVDGDRLYVPTATEVLEGTAPPTAGQVDTAGGSVEPASVGGSKTDTERRLVNINIAGLEELQSLNGIGPVTAQKIIDYRTENGEFGRIEDLMNVSGIGAKTFENLCAHIEV